MNECGARPEIQTAPSPILKVTGRDWSQQQMEISPLEMESAIGREVRDKMFAADPTCMHCRKPIASVEEATAVYFVRRAAWKLTHRAMCALSSILDAPRFSMNGKAGRSMPGIVRTSSDEAIASDSLGAASHKAAPVGFHYAKCGDFQCRECAESTEGCFLYRDTPFREEAT